MSDLRLAFRALRATPIVTSVALVSLALGIGANTAIFSLFNALMLRPLPVVDPERLVTVSSDRAIALGVKTGLGWNGAMWTAMQQSKPLFDGGFAWMSGRFTLGRSGEARTVAGLYASGDFFKTLGVPAIIGRTFTTADDVAGGEPSGSSATDCGNRSSVVQCLCSVRRSSSRECQSRSSV